MPKPPTSVRSIRLPDTLWATIQADADARGEKVNGVIARHLRIAYAPKDKLSVEHIADVTVASPLGAKAAAVQRRSGAIHVSAPLLQRKAHNPQPKKGKRP